MKQTQIYVCTPTEFILVDVDSGRFYTSLHTNVMNRHEKYENTIHSHVTQNRSENYIQLRNLDIEI